MSSSYIEVELNHQPIELCKLLKIANLVSGGGEAKVVISEGYVLLNGEVEYQKRKKIYHEDMVEFNGEVVQLILTDEIVSSKIDLSTNQKAPQLSNNDLVKQPKNKTHKSVLNSVQVITENMATPSPKKRKPIKFNR